MQLHDLVTPLEDLSDEELLEKLRQARHNRTVVRPAAAKRVERAETKTKRARATKVDKLTGSLSAAEKAALIEQLLKDAEK